MSITSLLNIGTTGINVARVSIEVTSENIANVNTEGYSRQRVLTKTGPVNNANGFPLGTGVQIADVQRNHDELLQLQLVKGNSALGESEAKETALNQIEPFFNELTDDGLGQTIEDFYNSWQDLSLNPQGAAERQTVLSRAETLTDTFHRLNTSLQDALESSDRSLSGLTSDVNDKAVSIASLNEQIMQTERLGGNANELRDQRELQVRQLAELVGVSYAEQSDGSLTVTLSGGEKLVDGNTSGSLATQANGTTGLSDIIFTSSGGVAGDVTATVGGTDNRLGKIGGTLQVRDEIIPGYLARLDEMANQMVTTVNSSHSSGYGLDGSQNNFFDPAGTTSGTIVVNSAMTTNKIAAAGSNPTTVSGPGDNSNALSLAALKGTTTTFTVAGQSTTATMSSYYNSLVSSVGIDTRNATNTTAQSQSFLKQLNTLRESNSGVSLDEELTNLIKYQRAYQASAKIISTASDMLDTVMGLIR
jgi:flagellar hook-associated protein 1